MKKGAIFDQDGLMFDTEAVYVRAWNLAGERMGFEVPAGFCAAVSGTCGENMRRIVREWFPGVDCDAFKDLTYEISYEMQSRGVPEKPGLHEILEYFRSQGVKLAVASSSHRRPIQRNLEQSGIRSCFEAVVSCEDVTLGKPDPEVFLTAAKRLGLSPADCYVFEDSFNGVRAGHAAGCCTVMIPDLRQPDEEIAKYYDACFPDLLAALEAVKNGEI